MMLGSSRIASPSSSSSTLPPSHVWPAHEIHLGDGSVVTVLSLASEGVVYRLHDALVVGDAVVTSTVVLRPPSVSTMLALMEQRPLTVTRHVPRVLTLLQAYSWLPQHFPFDTLPKLEYASELVRRYDDLYILHDMPSTKLMAVRCVCVCVRVCVCVFCVLRCACVMLCVCVSMCLCDTTSPSPLPCMPCRCCGRGCIPRGSSTRSRCAVVC
jgi:hypothetical protein